MAGPSGARPFPVVGKGAQHGGRGPYVTGKRQEMPFAVRLRSCWCSWRRLRFECGSTNVCQTRRKNSENSRVASVFRESMCARTHSGARVADTSSLRSWTSWLQSIENAASHSTASSGASEKMPTSIRLRPFHEKLSETRKLKAAKSLKKSHQPMPKRCC